MTTVAPTANVLNHGSTIAVRNEQAGNEVVQDEPRADTGDDDRERHCEALKNK